MVGNEKRQNLALRLSNTIAQMAQRYNDVVGIHQFMVTYNIDNTVPNTIVFKVSLRMNDGYLVSINTAALQPGEICRADYFIATVFLPSTSEEDEVFFVMPHDELFSMIREYEAIVNSSLKSQQDAMYGQDNPD